MIKNYIVQKLIQVIRKARKSGYNPDEHDMATLQQAEVFLGGKDPYWSIDKKLEDEKLILGLGFDSIFEYEKCMRCDYTNLYVPIPDKRPLCKNFDQCMNCQPFLLALDYKDRVERERGLKRGIPPHEKIDYET